MRKRLLRNREYLSTFWQLTVLTLLPSSFSLYATEELLSLGAWLHLPYVWFGHKSFVKGVMTCNRQRIYRYLSL